MKITFPEDAKVFITQTACQPHVVIDDGELYALLCILDDSSLIQIHQKLNSNSMEFSFLRDTIITKSIEKGKIVKW